MLLRQTINHPLTFIKTHWLGLVLALLIGAVIAAPPIIFRFSDDYQGVDMLKTNTEIHYLAQIQEVYDGDRLIINPFFKGLKDAPYLFPPLSPNIVAAFGQIFSLDLVAAVMITRFIIASLLAFLIYLFAATIAKNKIVGWVAAPFVLLGYSLLDPGYLLGLLTGKLRLAELTFIDYGRPINPQLSALFFFGYLLSFWHLLHQRERVWHYGVICALLLGASFYVYLFTWTFIYSLNGFLFFIYAGKKDWNKVKRIVWVSGAAGLMGAPYLLNVWQATHHPWYEESAVRFGFVRSRFFSISRLVSAVLILFLAVYKKLDKQTRLFFAGFFLTAFFVVNEQLITGRYVFNHHYHWYFITPLVIVLLVIILFSILSGRVKRRAVTYSIAAFLVVFIFYNGITVQAASYSFVLPQVVDEQRYAPVLAWLNQTTKKEEAVLASYTLARMIPALTHNNVYYHGTGIYSLVSDEQLIHAYLVYLYLDGVPQASMSEYLRDNQPELTAFVYGYKHAFQPGLCGDCVSETIRTRLANEYQTLSDATFLSYLKQYPVDYIIWDKKENPDWKLDKFALDKLQAFGDLIVYAVR